MANTDERGEHDGRSATDAGATSAGTSATDAGATSAGTSATDAGATSAGHGAAPAGPAPGVGPARGAGGKFLPKEADAGASKPEKPKTAKLALARLDAATLARVIGFAHSTAALTLKQPALALSDDECKKLAHAVGELAALYDIEVSARVMAWLQLFGVGAVIYGPRAIAIMATRSAPRQAPAAAVSSAAAAGAPKMDFSGDITPGNRTVN